MTLVHRLTRALAHGHGRDIPLSPDYGDDAHLGIAAAVLIAVTDRPDPGVILTRRADHLRTHAGQVALPGGRIDTGDADAIAAALREAEEEVALPRHHVTIIGTTDPFRTNTGFDIIPVVGVIPPGLPLHPQEEEVDTVFEAPLSVLLSIRDCPPKSGVFEGVERFYRETYWDDHRIWGVTAAIFVNLANRIGHEFVAS